jgi:hypothetical protein
MTTPFYLDWTFWTAVVALLALILSQLPPLYVLFRPAKLEVEAFDHVQLSHFIGQPTATLHIIVTNQGGREAKVKSIALSFRHEGVDQFELPGRGYFQAPSDQNAILLTPFRMASKAEWGHIVNFFMPTSRAEEKEVSQVKSAIRNDIVPKKTLPENEKVLLEASAEAVAAANGLFLRRFKWEAGEYEVTLTVSAEPVNASITRKYRIIVFESDRDQLKDYSKNYKHGAGVYYADAGQEPLFIPLSPI